MSRSLVLGNGEMLIALDEWGQVRDFYYPYAGEELQTGDDCIHRIGVSVDGHFSWFMSGEWNITTNYQKETLATDITAIHEGLQIEINFLDVIYNERNIFVRRAQITNKAKRKREVKLFFNQQFIISESARGNTAFYEPALNAVIHHRGRRVFLIGGHTHGTPFSEYTIGHFNSHGKEGTWRDAEDGVLGCNAIEHGKVDSTIAFSAYIAARDVGIFDYWIVAAETLPDAKKEHSYILGKTPDHLIQTTQDYWHAWVNKYQYDFQSLSPEVGELFKKSLLIMRTHVDKRGGIIASCDADIVRDGFDTYGYVWHRDASLITLSFIKAGYFDLAKRFFEFSRDVISDEGYFYHKYTVSKSLGSSWHSWMKDGNRRLPIQEDETALVLHVFWEYYQRSKHIEFVEEMYNPLVKKAADFLRMYRDPKTNLPRASYDLWEEKYGVTVFTTSTVYAGLTAAANFAALLGKEQDEKRYRTAAEEVREALLTHLVDGEGNARLRCVYSDGVTSVDDTLDVSNLYGLVTFNVLPTNDPRVQSIRKAILDELSPDGTIGGVMRHQTDYYYRSHQELHGNSWFITTLWLAENDIQCAENEEQIKEVSWYFDWVLKYAKESGIMSEQLDPYSGAQLSVAPLIWSHAQFVLTVILYLEKLEKLGLCKSCYPLKVR